MRGVFPVVVGVLLVAVLASAGVDTTAIDPAAPVGGSLDVDGERYDIVRPDGTVIAAAIWRPEVPEGQSVPVILDIGPYWGEGLETIHQQSREGRLFLQQIVPEGYAYGRVAVRGSSWSTGCMEMFGPNEQDDIDAVVTYFGQQDWSNGRVALYGTSYDGTTPWIAASYGNPHLATIVPIAGITDLAGLLFRNGTAEVRAPIIHLLYSTTIGMGLLEGNSVNFWYRLDNVPEQVCPEALEGFVQGPLTTATGWPHGAYWKVRDWRERVLANYEGSVYLVHGLQDWNVDASMAFPYLRELEDKGLDVKMLLGQWEHTSPGDEDPFTAEEWGERLLAWFDRYLKEEEDRDTGPAVEVQDSREGWRVESTWPPEDLEWSSFQLGDGSLERTAAAPGSKTLYNPARLSLPDEFVHKNYTTSFAVFDSPPFEEGLRFAGLPRVHLSVTPTSAVPGNLMVELFELSPSSPQRLAWGVMDLRFHAGGTQPQLIVPGETVVASMELFPVDAVVRAGHGLRLVVWPDTSGDPLPALGSAPVELHWGDPASVMRLPVVERPVAP